MKEEKSFVFADVKSGFLKNIIKEYELPINFKIDHKNKKFLLPVILCYKKESSDSKLYFTHIKIKDKVYAERISRNRMDFIISRELIALDEKNGLEISLAPQSIINIILGQLDDNKIEHSM